MSHTWNDAGLEECTARPGRDKNTGRLSVVGVPVNMQHMFQQSLVQFIIRVVDIPAAADLGTHSAHCARPWTLTGTVFGWLWTRLLLCSDRCSGWSR